MFGPAFLASRRYKLFDNRLVDADYFSIQVRVMKLTNQGFCSFLIEQLFK